MLSTFRKKIRMTPSGFTLLELVVTIALLSTVLAMVAPNLLSYVPKSRLNGAARKVMTDLVAARMKAVKTSSRTQVNFIGDTQYILNDDADGDGTVSNPEGDALLRDISDLYPDVTLTSTDDPVFLPRGTVIVPATVTLTNPVGSKTVTLSVTGRARIS